MIYMKNYNVVIGSPIEYDKLTADILLNNKYIARVQMENGIDEMILEFFEEAALEKVKLDDFLEAIAEAKKLLLK